jgi:hypothetical protein
MRLYHFFLEGGWGMWFVLLFGLITLAQAIGFARRPDERRRAALETLNRATLYSIIATVALDLAAVARAPTKPPWSEAPRIELVILEGIAESLAPAILGFALLSFAWMIGAVGQRRLARELDG